LSREKTVYILGYRINKKFKIPIISSSQFGYVVWDKPVNSEREDKIKQSSKHQIIWDTSKAN
jgi:hypothetical protein